MISDNKQRLALTLDAATIAELEALARRYRCSKSSLAQILILDGMERIRRTDQEPAPEIPAEQ